MKSIFSTVMTAALTALICLPLFADPVVDIPPHNTLNRPEPYSTEWVHWAWTGDNAPYTLAEKEIAKALMNAYKAQRNPKAVLDWYGEAARHNPGSALAQFKWAYAASGLVAQEGFVNEDALRAMQGIDPGNIREYARIRYCLTLTAEPNKNHDDINLVAERLLKASPNDDYVRQLYIYDLVGNPSDMPKALSLAHGFVEREPLNAKTHSVMAYVYENQFFGSHRAVDRDNAIREYKRFLALAPANDAFRPQATYLIGALMKEDFK